MTLTSAKIATIVTLLALLYALEGIAPMFGRRGGRLRHSLLNIALGLLNGLVVALIFTAALAMVALWADRHRIGLLHWLAWPAWSEWIIAIVLFDLWMYVWHRANHRIGFLWRFHQVHHSDAALAASSALRFHTGEIALSSLARLVIVPLLGIRIEQLLVYELILQPIILLHHSTVRFPRPIDRALALLIVTPRIHWVHHSNVRAETDSNYGSIFSFWDRILGTFRRRAPDQIIFGLEGEPPHAGDDLARMLKMPFIKKPQPPAAPPSRS